jgi:DNA (cytosine-5)-methyltransferase 1
VNFYNDNDPKVCAWLRELIKQGHLPPGHVDSRSILELKPEDLHGYTQVHLFAGIGGWPYALMLAGWPADRPVWTASCPCQPLSCAGQQKGHADERHLWPAVYRLIAECGPPEVFGEQVASTDGREWFAGVRADLEGAGYACGCANLPAASVGAPHRRERLFFVADSKRDGGRADKQERGQEGRVTDGGSCGMGHANGAGSQQGRQAAKAAGHGGSSLADGDSGVALGDTKHAKRRTEHQEHGEAHGRHGFGGDGNAVGLADSERKRLEGQRGHERDRDQSRRDGADATRSTAAGGATGPWVCYDIIPCRDGKARRIEPGTFPLAHGIPARVGRLRGYGNAICPQTAAVFISAFLDTELTP